MTGLGYVSLAVDSFATRGIKEACTRPMPALMLARQGDALGALSHLSKLPFVDPQRIAVLGGSQGGMVALQLASTKQVEIFDFPRDLKFRAAVTYYLRRRPGNARALAQIRCESGQECGPGDAEFSRCSIFPLSSDGERSSIATHLSELLIMQR